MQIYVDDIVYGCSNDALGVEFAKLMSYEFEMSLLGELKYFLGLQIN